MLTLLSTYPIHKEQSSFWLKDEDYPYTHRYIKHSISSEVSFTTPFRSYQNYSLKLTKGRLHFTDENVLYFCKIKWALLTPFTETRDSYPVYGFTIGLSENLKQDIYLNSQEELDCWVKVLTNYTTLTDIDYDYIIIKNIDSGKFGSVKLCQELKGSQQYALKQIPKVNLEEAKYRTQLFNEISLLRKLDHKNIIKLYRVYEDYEFFSLVLEYVPHGNLLKNVLRKGKFEKDEVLNFSISLFKVLKYIHSFGIMHRDIKLENILINSENEISDFKIGDFGLACYSDKTCKMKSGSPGYMAPEVLRGNSYSTKIDIFSAGIIIYILFTGYSPLIGNSYDRTIQKNLECNIDFNCKRLKKQGEETIRWLKLILQVNPMSRPSANEVLRILKTLENRAKKSENSPTWRCLIFD